MKLVFTACGAGVSVDYKKKWKRAILFGDSVLLFGKEIVKESKDTADSVYGKCSPSMEIDKNWMKKFQHGCTLVFDKPRRELM